MEGEYIETTENTPSSLSNSPVKEENSEMKGLTDAHQDKIKEDDGNTEENNTNSVPSYTPIKSEHGDRKDFLPLPATSGVQVTKEIVDNGNDLVTMSITTFFTP